MYIDKIDIVTLNRPYDKGKKSKKLEVDSHFNSDRGMTLKKLIPLLESYNENIEHYDHIVKLTLEFEEIE